MKRIKIIFALAAFSLMAVVLPSAASAQWRDRDRGRNNNYYYGNISRNINNIKNRSKTFEKLADRYEDRSDRWGNRGDYRGDRLESLAKQFRSAVDDLSKSYDRGRAQYRSSDEARRVLSIGEQISRQVYSSRVNNNMRYEWDQINNDLDVIAAAYGMNNNGRYRNNRNNRNGSWRDRFPF